MYIVNGRIFCSLFTDWADKLQLKNFKDIVRKLEKNTSKGAKTAAFHDFSPLPVFCLNTFKTVSYWDSIRYISGDGSHQVRNRPSCDEYLQLVMS